MKVGMFLKKNYLVLISLAVILLFLAPYIFRGELIHMKISDVLDAWAPQQKILAASGKAFSLNPDAKIDNIIDGIRISGFVNSGWNVITVLFMIFKPFTAFAINVFIMAFAAFGGMRLLLRKYIIKDGEISTGQREWIITGASLCFALLPFYPSGGLSIAGLPLLSYCFLNIKNNDWSWTDFAYIAFFPFYSVLPFAGLFIFIYLSALFLIDWVNEKRFHLPYFLGLVLLGGLYLFTHFHLIYSFLAPNYNSFRKELATVPMSSGACFKTFLHNILQDRSHVIGAQRLFVAVAAVAAVLLGIARKVKEIKFLLLLIILTVFHAFLWGFKYWEGAHFLREKFQLLNALDLARFYWLNPFLWYVIFAVSLGIIWKFKLGKIAVFILLAGQLGFMFSNYNWEYRYLTGRENPYTYSLSYKEYYSEALFEKMARFIGKPKKDYRMASIGIPPGIAQYNGFYTLDVFCNVYPLEYKHRFRRIIAKELEKSKDIKTVFDKNGKRCYLLSAELHTGRIRGLTFSRGISKRQQYLKIKRLELNIAAFTEMGGEYIFSAVKILNYAENGLSLEGKFEDNESPWKIYLYKVK